MNIYYVNRNTKYRGPYDIIDSNRQHIIKVGDVCLRDSNDGVSFLLVTNSENSWNACKRVGLGSNSELAELGNTLLFSFDGLHKRKGNIPLLVQLSDCYREKVIIDFLQNAKDILEYKTDFWDASLFVQFLSSSQILVDRKKETTSSPQPISPKYPTLFAKYLHDDHLKVLNDTLARGGSLKDAYMAIRSQYPMSFRDALMTFLLENPDFTIYDKPPVKVEPEKEELKTPPIEITHEVSVNEYDTFCLSSDKKKEFKKLLKSYREGDKKAFDRIVQENQKLVEIIAETYKGRGVDYKDLVQDGIIGLIKAIERYDPKRDVSFPFYAKWYIHRFIIDGILKMQSIVRMPINQITLYSKIRRSIERYEQEFGFEPSASEIEIDGYDDMDNIKYLSNLPGNLKDITSLTSDMDHFVSDSSADDILMKEARTHYVNNIISKLKYREAYVLRHIYGIGERIESLSEIGDKLGLTRERVRQIAVKAVRHLREILKLSTKQSNSDNGARSVVKFEKGNEKNKSKTNSERWSSDDLMQRILFDNGFKIENDECGCKIYDIKERLIYQSEGNIVPILGFLYRIYRNDSNLFVHRFVQEGSRFSLGQLAIYAGNTSPLYKALDSMDYSKQVGSIVCDYSNMNYKILVDGKWYDNNGMPLINEADKEEKGKFDMQDDNDDEWFFVDDIPFSNTSKYFLDGYCRVVLSPLGYYLEVTGDYIKMGDLDKGFSYNKDKGNLWIKSPKDNRGYKMVHDIKGRSHLIGYLRMEKNVIVFTNPKGEEYTITFEDN